jgi:hypothetical protein
MEPMVDHDVATKDVPTHDAMARYVVTHSNTGVT